MPKVLTSAAGAYRLTVKHSGSFTLRAVKEGYTPKTTKVTTTQGTREQNFILNLIETPAFESSAVRKSKMLITTNRDSAGNIKNQTFKNPLLNKTVRSPGGTPVTTGVDYRISAPAGYSGGISVTADGTVSFGAQALSEVNSGGPQTVTVEAVYKGKTVSYTFTVTDHFSPRSQHSSVVLGKDIYVIAGRTSAAPRTFSSEVWRSSDEGLTWDQVAGAKRFTPERIAHGSVVLDGNIYVIAGVNRARRRNNDVWKSADRGLSWDQVAAGTRFSARFAADAQVLNGEIYLMGGYDGTNNLDDVWKSAGGVSWNQVTTTSPRFPARQYFASVVLPGSSGSADELFFIGGAGAGTPQNVYKSSDGESWTQLTPASGSIPGFTSTANNRRNHTAAVLGGHIYLIAGRTGTNAADVQSDVWKSADRGENWGSAPITSNAAFGKRYGHSSAVLGNTMYVIGGYSIGGRHLNDVWKSTDGITWLNVHKD